VTLFISNFNNFIVKSILLLLVLFFSYTIFIYTTSPNINKFQNQWAGNYAKAQEYIYSDKKYKTVIVGSSMASCLYNEELSNDVYNLSFAGGGVLTGLNIIIKSGKIPENILIETNTVERATDTGMIKRLFPPLVWKIKKFVIALQEQYQPINVFTDKIQKLFGTTNKEKL